MMLILCVQNPVQIMFRNNFLEFIILHRLRINHLRSLSREWIINLFRLKTVSSSFFFRLKNFLKVYSHYHFPPIRILFEFGAL